MTRPHLCSMAAAALTVAALTPALSSAQALNLSRYTLSATYAAGVGEASGITFNWDNNSLMLAGGFASGAPTDGGDASVSASNRGGPQSRPV